MLAFLANLLPTPQDPSDIPVWFWSIVVGCLLAALLLTIGIVVKLAASFLNGLLARIAGVEGGLKELHGNIDKMRGDVGATNSRLDLIETSLDLTLAPRRVLRVTGNNAGGEGGSNG